MLRSGGRDHFREIAVRGSGLSLICRRLGFYQELALHAFYCGGFGSVAAVYWSPGMPKPDLSHWQGDWIIAFKADLILPRSVLDRARKGAINSHPSPPKYRGLGGYWWAIHNGDAAYGVTVHHMDERIDHGEIINTLSFPIKPDDTVASLKHTAAMQSLDLLQETLKIIQSGQPLVPCGIKWEPHLYTSKQLALAQRAAALKTLQEVQCGIIPDLTMQHHPKWITSKPEGQR